MGCVPNSNGHSNVAIELPAEVPLCRKEIDILPLIPIKWHSIVYLTFMYTILYGHTYIYIWYMRCIYNMYIFILYIMYISYVYIICIYYMYILYVYIICIYYMYILYVYIICIYYMYILYSVYFNILSDLYLAFYLSYSDVQYFLKFYVTDITFWCIIWPSIWHPIWVWHVI